MKKVIFSLFIFFIGLSFVSAKEASMYFFYRDGCPHCAKEEEFLEEMESKYEELTILRYEVGSNLENRNLLYDMASQLNINISGVPFTIIGEEYVSGYTTSYNTKMERMIKGLIEYKDEKECPEDENIINIPLIGEVNAKNVSISLVAIVIGLVDGFNPCAMWILLFLISTLIGMNNRKRMWIIGLTFLLSSASMYLLIMMSWLNIVVSIGFTNIIKYIIASIALIAAIFNIRKFIKSKNSGCEVVSDEKRSKLFNKIKKFTHEKSLWLALLGVITLAISVNFIELVCSAGLPVVFMEILAINNITGVSSLFYTLLYILFFLIDDLIIFVIAMITLKISAISTKYTKYSHLIGGIIMLIIGLLLIFKPEWIMFNF